uniref:Small ribosomal subunit protein uS14c n=1 Tax=Dichotomaria marginata TaxID=268567 RepID=A0A1G4NSF8_9FLOR|nr:Ribosomal protein S14 [Dichotomaria marginata]SCW21587.1 Ribosomal protein S14 [Dichotomaria marginata]
MAKKSMIEREKKRIKLFTKYEKKRKQLREKIQSIELFQEKLDIQKKMQELPRNSMKTRLRNRCWISGRSRGFYRDFGLSRHALREMAHECLLPGVTKSSW